MNIAFHQDKNEVFEAPASTDLFQLQTVDYSTTPSNLYFSRPADCEYCEGKSTDYNCVACLCQVCFHKTTSEKRFRCYLCKKSYHEWCRPKKNATAHVKWLCDKCEELESQPVPSCSLSSINEEHSYINSSGVSSINKEHSYTSSSANASCSLASSSSTVAGSALTMESKHSIVDRVFNNIISSPPKKIRMNNVPRTQVCDSVPRNHFGPVPGVEVGTCWMYRLQVSECGVHRPLVAGIHGREAEGAFSIVLSGVYTDDKDYGDEFFYSGSGGRKSDPTKRLSPQVMDQELTRHNRALAICCAAPVNDVIGAEAIDWKAGKPVRVVRKRTKDSEYAPEEGYRYDGIYKVVKYKPETGHTGFRVWRFFLRRDDPSPAPWTELGKARIQKLNLRLILPQNVDICEKLEREPDSIVTRKRHRQIMEPVHAKKKKRNQERYDIVEPYRGAKHVASTENANVTSSSEPIATTPASNIDTKPDVKKLVQNIPWPLMKAGGDAKPDVDALNRLMSLRSSRRFSLEHCAWSENSIKIESTNGVPNIKIEPSNGLPNIKIEQDSACAPLSKPVVNETYSSFDIIEDVKPDVNVLNAEIFRNSGIVVPNESSSKGADLEKDDSTTSEKKNSAEISSVSCPSVIKSEETMADDVEIIEDPPPIVIDCDSVQPVVSQDGIVNTPVSSFSIVSCVSSTSTVVNVAEFQSRITEPLKLVITQVSSNTNASKTEEKETTKMNASEAIKRDTNRLPAVSPSDDVVNNNELDSVSRECISLNLPEDINQLINSDTLNASVWDYLRSYKTKEEFMKSVEVMFTCPQCNQKVEKPCTTICGHNICYHCLELWFQQKTYSCPSCHTPLPSNFIRYQPNLTLSTILRALFPDYTSKP